MKPVLVWINTIIMAIVIAALAIALLVQQERASRREAELRSKLQAAEFKASMLEHQNAVMNWRGVAENRSSPKLRPDVEPADEK